MKLSIQEAHQRANTQVCTTRMQIAAIKTELDLLSEKQRCSRALSRSQQISAFKVRLFFLEKNLKDELLLAQTAGALLFDVEAVGLANVQQSACDYAARLARDGFRLQWDRFTRQINIVCFSFDRLSHLFL